MISQIGKQILHRQNPYSIVFFSKICPKILPFNTPNQNRNLESNNFKMTSVKVQRSPSVYELQWHKRVMTLERLPCDYLLLEKHWPDIKPKRTERIKWGQQILLISDKMEAQGWGDPPSGHFRPDAAIRGIEEKKYESGLREEKRRESAKMFIWMKYNEVPYTVRLMVDNNISYLTFKQTLSCSDKTNWPMCKLLWICTSNISTFTHRR